MNIFEKYGSYDVVRQAAENYKKSGNRVTAAGLELQCLEYRRQHNIYEAGDKVVYCTLPHERLFYVKAVLNGSIVVRECLDALGARCFSEFNPYNEIRHATDAEIEAGKRL